MNPEAVGVIALIVGALATGLAGAAAAVLTRRVQRTEAEAERRLAVERKERLREELTRVVDAALALDRIAEDVRWEDIGRERISDQLNSARAQFESRRASLLLEPKGERIAYAFDVLVRHVYEYLLAIQNRDLARDHHAPGVEEQTKYAETVRAEVKRAVATVIGEAQSILG